MKHGMQIKIAKKSCISPAFLSEIINNKKRPSWNTAKRLARTTSTTPELWLEGDTESIKSALSEDNSPQKNKNKGTFATLCRSTLKKLGIK